MHWYRQFAPVTNFPTGMGRVGIHSNVTTQTRDSTE